MKTALITGIRGQDGSYLAELLERKGYRVVGTSRSSGAPRPSSERIEVRRLALEEPTEVARCLAEVAPDEVYHLAGQSSVGRSFEDPEGTFRSIAVSTANVLEAARRSERRPRVFFAGSGEVFGDTGTARATEQTPFAPASPYAVAKANAVERVRSYRSEHGLFASVGFLYNHESSRRPETFVTRKIVRGACAISAGKAATLELGDLSVVRDWGYAPEYVEAMWRSLQVDAPDDFVIATGESHPLGRFVELVFGRLELSVDEHVVSNPKWFRPSEVRALYADPSRAEQVLGWKATTRLEGLAKVMLDAELLALETA